MTADRILEQNIMDNPEAKRESYLQQQDQFILDVDEDEQKAKAADLMKANDHVQMRSDYELGDADLNNDVQSNADTEKVGPQAISKLKEEMDDADNHQVNMGAFEQMKDDERR